jgi:hypothetical protein
MLLTFRAPARCSAATLTCFEGARLERVGLIGVAQLPLARVGLDWSCCILLKSAHPRQEPLNTNTIFVQGENFLISRIFTVLASRLTDQSTGTTPPAVYF